MEIKIIDAEILSEISSYAMLMYKGPSKDNLIISKVQVCPLSREQEQDHLVVGRISRPADQIDPSPYSTLPPENKMCEYEINHPYSIPILFLFLHFIICIFN